MSEAPLAGRFQSSSTAPPSRLKYHGGSSLPAEVSAASGTCDRQATPALTPWGRQCSSERDRSSRVTPLLPRLQMFARVARSQAVRTLRTPAVRRGMCTAVEEATETLHPMSYKKPENAMYYLSGFLMYVFAIRWQGIDKKMALEAAEKAAAHAPEPVAEVRVLSCPSAIVRPWTLLSLPRPPLPAPAQAP